MHFKSTGMFFKSHFLKFRLFLIICALRNVTANAINQNVATEKVTTQNVVSQTVLTLNVATNNTTESVAFIQDEPHIIVNRVEMLPNSTVKDIANGVMSFLGVNLNNTKVPRINELKSKLDKINSYVIDKEKYGDLLLNEIRETNLTDLNFFKALQDNDDFDFLKKNDYKNLYLKLKEKLNRDDVMNMLVDTKNTSDIVQKVAQQSPEEDLNILVDKILGETPKDRHKYNMSSIQSIYWDPEAEIRLNRDDYHDGRRLYKGVATTIRNFPFMAAVHVMGSFWCGGAIYWSDLVITSAACLQLIHSNRFYRENARVVHVRVGSNHSLTNGEIIEANEVYFHPSYNPRTLRNNIAIIRLNRHIHFSSHTVPKAIQISHKEHNIPLNEKVTLLGWGANSAGGRMPYSPMFLKRLVLPVYPNWYCKEVYGDKFIPVQMFCAGTQTTGEGACDHDAGGPAIINGQLYGIISFGPSVCGYRDAPTVFTHVGYFSDWIETINETMPDSARFQGPTTTTTPSPLIESTPEKIEPGNESEDVQIVSETAATKEAVTKGAGSEAANAAATTPKSPARQRLVRILPVTRSNPKTLKTRGPMGTTYVANVKIIPPPQLHSGMIIARKQAQPINPTPLVIPRDTSSTWKKT